MIKIAIIDLAVATTPHKVDVRSIFSFEHASFVHISLKPGETLKKHITPVDACFFGLEGEGKVEIGDETEVMRKDDFIFSPAGVAHRLFNDKSMPFKFLVIKAPSPKSQETKIL